MNESESNPYNSEYLAKPELELICSGVSIPSVLHPSLNEDCFSIDLNSHIVMILDGLGGQANGEKASATAQKSLLDSLRQINSLISIENQLQQIQQAVITASMAISTEVPGGGSTATVVKFVKDSQDELHALVGHIGDSRAYLYRENTLTQITEDDDLLSTSPVLLLEDKIRIHQKIDSLTNNKDRHRLTKGERYFFDNRNQLSQALGDQSPIQPHTYDVKLKPGDILGVMSDGIHDNLTNDEIKEIFTQESSARIPYALTEKAKNRSLLGKKHSRANPDDMSVIAIGIETNATTLQNPIRHH